MKGISGVVSGFGALALCFGLAAELHAQQGQRGGAGGGAAGGGGRGNIQQVQYDRSARAIDSGLSAYLDSETIRNILTPGEYSEWTLTLRDGQVVIAEAWSDAFDPAVEIVAQEKILASNDDRYPGDQRPLLFWRAERAGTYMLRVRSFRDKAGGPCMVRFRIYDVVDLSDGSVDAPLSANRFLFRLPMKTGEIKRIVIETSERPGYAGVALGPVISPFGLPDIGLAAPLRPVVADAIMAPLDGDYYLVGSTAYSSGVRVRAVVRNFVPLRPAAPNDAAPAKTSTNTPTVWAMTVKAGQTVEVAAPDLDSRAVLLVTEQPGIPEYDKARPETNPFFPQPPSGKPEKGPAFSLLPGRARDNRLLVFAARRDAALWIASNAAGRPNAQFVLTAKPAAHELPLRERAGGRLAIGRTDYWAFNGSAGDVLSFRASAADFVEHLTVRDPDLLEVWSADAGLDKPALDWSFVVRKPGRYLVAISCAGDGGSGEYVLSRDVSLPRTFSKTSTAEGELRETGVDVWKFTAKPDEPLLVRWTSSNWAYEIGVQDELGVPMGFPLENVNRSNSFAILKVDRPTTFLLVLSSKGQSARYSIGLSGLPLGEPRER